MFTIVAATHSQPLAIMETIDDDIQSAATQADHEQLMRHRQVEVMHSLLGMEEVCDVVDPSRYRSFCFRGQGRANFVISAKEIGGDSARIVWRLAKHRKSNTISTKPKSRVVNAYFDQLITPFLSSVYLIKARLVNIPSEKLHRLAKIPSLPQNFKLERWEELWDEAKYPAHASFFPLSSLGSREAAGSYVSALEMLDATRIPSHRLPTPLVYGPTITVEVKPKQGFYQSHPGVDVPYCNNCIVQIEKWKSATFDRMYDFCPLELYSGDLARMTAALGWSHCSISAGQRPVYSTGGSLSESLIRDPHRNLRIFVDGNVVHDELCHLPPNELTSVLFPTLGAQANITILTTVIACILAGMESDCCSEFQLRPGSVLAELLAAQQLDTIGIVRAFELFKVLPANLQRELRKKSNLLNRKTGLPFLQSSDVRSLLERYLLAATMKDCSVMLSFRLVNMGGKGVELMNGAWHQQRPSPVVVSAAGGDGSNALPLHFAHCTRIVDLDPKTGKNLENAFQRFTAGVKAIKSNPYIHKIHKPCRRT